MTVQTSSSNSKQKFFAFLKWTFSIILFTMTIYAIADKSFVSTAAFATCGSMLFPLLADFRRKNFPFLNNRNVKIILFIASYLIGVINLVKSTPNPKAYREEKKVTPSQPKQEPASTDNVTYDANGNEIKSSGNNGSTEKPMQSQNSELPRIEVGFMNLKKVDDLYRYFFYIRNKGTSNFHGDLKVSLITYSGSKFDQTYSDINVHSEGGSYVYTDVYNSTDTRILGDEAIAKFSYEVTINGSIVKSGEGQIY